MNTIVFGHPSANPLLLAIEAASEPNSYLLLLINALEGPQKEPERIRPPLHTPPKPAIVEQEEDLQQANAENTTENIAETVISSSDTTGLLSTVSHQSTQPVQEKSIQQANAENTAEKPSGNKAPSTKNTAQLSKIPRHMLSTVPHQIITQQAENTTTTWPVIPTALITSQEEEL
ncbi:hypothetical protein HO173_001504 [Letharia columbiana]|uniref:Uncharacterized protein n=1 Tax=Letharia columbiana TaxID=112416 RepID=A0A8H6G3U0_9LECA|nr:uncharacterized protein HO173_001504 [Letharia columbiana]KAF6239896.1 hypothetical protein HO173_001504 [Letharia columbiana]